MKKIELTVTIYLKEEQDLSYVKIAELCENVGNALTNSVNVISFGNAIEVKHPLTYAITGEFYKEV